jgi:amino acid transporter
MITTATEEAQTSKQNMPLAMITSIIIMIITYVLLSGALILVTPYWKVNSVAAFSEAFASRGISWAKYVIR